LLDIINNNDELNSYAEEIYYDLEEDLQKYGWKDNKFVDKIDIKKIRIDVNKYFDKDKNCN
jgi:hypothetical protein